jgi:alpha-D-xyloside xylohydrolase
MKLMRIHGLVLLLLVITLSSFREPVVEGYKKEADGVVVQLKSTGKEAPRQLKIRVVSEKIIQVLSTPEEALQEVSSLMIAAPAKTFSDWQLTEKGKDLIITTNLLVVRLDANTAELTFSDKKGNVILQEAGTPAFTPVTLNQEQSYAVEKGFKAAEGEAFYGLGQHQTALMNYRGYQVDLTQYNGVAVVPFLMSSKGYGILWDNNSITKFGDVRPYQPLSAFTLYDKEGNKGGLTATYASQANSEAAPVVLQESAIDYEFLEDQKDFPKGFTMSGESLVTWEGFLESDQTGVHDFRLPSAGYVKVWIDNKLLLDKWREAWNPGLAVFTHKLEKGKKHPVKIEWRPDGGESYIGLSYLSPQSQQEQQKVSFASEAADQLNYYFVWGKNMDEVISGYRTLTGKAQVMPKWVMGFWQSRERYKTQEEVLSTVKEFRKRNIPLDNIVLDWSYWKEDQWGSHDFDETRFPDPEGMIKELHEEHNAKIMISVWPKFYEGIEHYKQLDAKGLLYKQNIKNQQRDWIGKGYVSTFYDAFNPEARELFWEMLSKKLYSKGIDAWWLDATEPDILSNASIEHRKSLMNPTYLGSATEYFNAYSLMNAKGIYEGQREVNPNERVFILTRSAFAGLQRYGAATWSGDISSTFEELARQIPGGLNFSLSGLPYWTTDIGGFFVENKYDRPNPEGEALEEWRELNTRWHQFGAFTPLFRSHGQYPYREVFNIAPEDHKAYQSMVYYNQLRYRLMPYIYSLTGHVYHKDYTLMRALVMDFGHDKNVLNIGDQYMFGPSILVSPVTEYKSTNKKLYLPQGTGWYNLYDGSYQQGGRHITADAPYERMPLFVKEGAILPYGPEIQYTTEKPAETITLYVYAGKDGSFELYEDENTNYNYEDGKFSTIPFTYNEKNKTLTIGARKGGFEGMLDKRTFNIVYVSPKKAKNLQFDAKPDQVVNYNGSTKTVKLRQ